MSDQAVFVSGRMKPRVEPESHAGATLTDRDVLRLIVENADLLNAEAVSGGLWLLAPLPREALDYLAGLDGELDGLEPEDPEGATEVGLDPEAEDGDSDTCVEDQALCPRLKLRMLSIHDTATCEDYEPDEYLSAPRNRAIR